VRTTKSATVEYNRFGGEAYTPKRMVYDLEVPIVSQNEMLSLSPRVGVLFTPERSASVLYTCYVPADATRVLYRKPQAAVAANPAEKADTAAA